MSPMTATILLIWFVSQASSGMPQRLTQVIMYLVRNFGFHFSKEWNGVAPPSFSSSIICCALSSVRPSSKTISSPIYFGDTSAPISQCKSSSTLSNITRFFSLPTQASLSHLFPVFGMSRYTDDHDPSRLWFSLPAVLVELELLLFLVTTSTYDP
ncbi:hypothetical protein GLYMA_01G060800v4 [Glycine max]|uniref:Secreted protein n=1 Tax=Glycine max TaxID=3847 RepID=A0A0R0L752_SOYBN|nr:hypothetical protein JHK85_000624 [Glycine max]KAH1161837.1 hypothetical protein GYH30_000633 [Glycine max]KRH75072.1 hypothetical protein GLYMA_01G060800v4 [Glycine max]